MLCLHQTGSDFQGNAYPLFSQGLGGGYYTPPYLYGELLWTRVFGHSVYAFRAFLALITTATIFFLYEWLKKRVNHRTAMLAALFASISPWVFQFSRIAWDPPLAPFFIVLGLWCLDLKKRWGWIAGALAIALAGYSYPPCRIQVAILLLALPGLSWRKKLEVFGVFALANIPLLYRAYSDGNFTARGNMLVLWSDYPMNPYHDAGIFGLVLGFFSQFFEHFNPDFLLGHGDHNVRHSTQRVGILSYPEALVLVSGVIYFAVSSIREKKIKWNRMLVFALVGLASGIAPAALTWEGVPHSLRAIGAWPFFVMAAAMSADILLTFIQKKWPSRLPWFVRGLWASAMLFAAFFMGVFFTEYPERSLAWFQDDNTPLGSAYRKMTEYQVYCADLQSMHRK